MLYKSKYQHANCAYMHRIKGSVKRIAESIGEERNKQLQSLIHAFNTKHNSTRGYELSSMLAGHIKALLIVSKILYLFLFASIFIFFIYYLSLKKNRQLSTFMPQLGDFRELS